ncbi:MAG: hypothetical protein ABH810_00195 [bacterium]
MAIKELLMFYILRKLIGPERARKFDAISRKHAPRVASVICGFISVAHTLRLVFGWEVVIAGQLIPGWVSVVVALVTAYLSYSLCPAKQIEP